MYEAQNSLIKHGINWNSLATLSGTETKILLDWAYIEPHTTIKGSPRKRRKILESTVWQNFQGLQSNGFGLGMMERHGELPDEKGK